MFTRTLETLCAFCCYYYSVGFYSDVILCGVQFKGTVRDLFTFPAQHWGVICYCASFQMILTTFVCILYLKIFRCVHLICVWFIEEEGEMDGGSEVEVIVKSHHIQIQTLFLRYTYKII